MTEPRRAPRPSSAQWHAGLLDELVSIIDRYSDPADRPAVSASPGSPFVSAGPASAVGDRGPGWYRTRRLSPSEFGRLDSALLAPGGDPDVRHFAVLDSVRDDRGDLVRVQPGAAEDGLELCLPRPDPVRRYRRLLRGLGGPEAVKPLRPFARGDLDGLRRFGEDVDAQARAVAAAGTAGLHAIWAPPATGATAVVVDVLAEVISSRQRCLFVSSDPLAVDTALLRLQTLRNPQPGQVVRVGPIQLPELGDIQRGAGDDLGLLALAEARRPELLEDRQRATDRVLTLREASALRELRDARSRLTGFDPVDYRQARQRVDDQASRELNGRQLAAAEEEQRRRHTEASEVDADLLRAAVEVQTLRQQASSVRVLAARGELSGLPRGVRYWRLRRELGAELAAAERSEAEEAARLSGLQTDQPDHGAAEPTAVTKALQEVGGEPTDSPLARALERARPLRERAEQARSASTEADRQLSTLVVERDRLAARPAPSAGDAELCAAAERAGLPELAERLPLLEEAARRAEAELESASAELEELQQRVRAEAASAEAGVLGAAAVVATTMERLIDSRALAAHPYDLVVIDRAVTTPLPDVAFAAARAGRTCLLIGDPLQAGPPRDHSREHGHYWDHDVFEHVGLLSPRAAQHHPGCVLLDTQRRFGEVITELANRVGYQGVLRTRAHSTPETEESDDELVWVDTDGLPEARVEGGADRHWAVGAALSRELAARHVLLGQSVAVLTPYPEQARLTRLALDDAAAADAAASADQPELRAVPVGTSAELAGRAFDVVVVDTVEDGQGWIAGARRDAVGPDADRRRDALRDVLVGLTRAGRTVYLIAGGRALRGDRGTPMGELAQLCAEGVVSRLGARRVLRDSPAEESPAEDSAVEDLGVQDDGDRAVVDS